MSDQNPTPATAPLIDAQTMRERFRDYGLNTVNQVVTMMMSGVYATAALALADILRTPDFRVLRLAMWLWFSLGATATIVRQMHINALIVQPSPAQPIYQLGLGFLHVSAFACVAAGTGGADGWRYATVMAVLIAAFVAYGVSRVPSWLPVERYSSDLTSLVTQRVDDARRIIRQMPILLGANALIAALALAIPDVPGVWYWTFVGLVALGCSMMLLAIRRELNAFQLFVEGVPPAKHL